MSAQRIRIPASGGLLVATLLLAACGAGVRPSSTLSAADGAAISDSVSRLVAAWREAVVARDTVALATFYSTDAAFRWIEDGEVRYRSATELAEAWRGTVQGVAAMDLLLDQLVITPVGPGAAVVTTAFTQKVTDTAGRSGGFTGATSLVAVSTPDGWRFLTGHTSATANPSTAHRH